VIVDIGVPRNVDASVRDMPDVALFDIDDLQNVVDEHLAQRQAATSAVNTIIAYEREDFLRWLRSLQVVPLITELRHQAESVVEAELEHALRRLPDLDAQEQEIVAQLAHRIANKLLHSPTVALKSRAARGDHYAYSHAVRQLFALEEHE
jgi:glutamyl-tRNA reductase